MVTEREKFIVPIVAVGVRITHLINLINLIISLFCYLNNLIIYSKKKRAMIDFPDMLDFGTCPVILLYITNLIFYYLILNY